ncbi:MULTISPECIES: UrcA family protein [Sphingosinicellaceae]|uniref:UrcA family protein n=1 Tax=Sphingosinicellaceae TaxID=2820280 RepID=UPI001C1E5423|nr:MULTISPECIES: UrcA family protein [Polymorphobacter]QYE33065.1 UrcA family protein [Polymorphobacter sp. PAMC 29334]UAJ12294.1 UrcA family protein [Polymorphobacter megasporae]
MRNSALFSLAFLASAPSLAAGPLTGSVPIQHVSYADLNLASNAGQATLQHRVARAIDVVCGETYGAPLSVEATTKTCKRQALVSTARQMTVAVANATTQTGRETQIAIR